MAAKETKEIRDFIVAFEFGSSKITGIAGQKQSNGSITVLAYAREDSSAFIKRGMVYNIDKTAQCLSNIKQKLEKSLKATIGKAYIGLGGQSLHSIRNTVLLPLPAGTIISRETVDALMRSNLECKYTDQEVLHVVPQEYKLGTTYQIDPVGVMSESIEGQYLNIIARTSLRSNIEKCLHQADVKLAGYIIAPLALADSVLTDAEKRSGCALVDLGAETTTVSIYKNNILRHLAVIPLGGNNITKDISGQQIEEEDAEELKLRYGCAYNEEDATVNEEKTYPVTTDREIDAKLLNDIVESRMEEIIANVWEQIRLSNSINDLMAGIVLTGGASNLKNVEMAFKKRTNMEKVKIAKFVQQTIEAKNPDIKSKDGSLNTTLALLISGKENCYGDDLGTMETLFDAEGKPYSQVEAEKRKKAEEEAALRLQQEAEAARLAELERKKVEEEEQRRRKKENSFFNKFKKKIVNFGQDLLSEDEN